MGRSSMIGRKSDTIDLKQDDSPRSFDDFALRLGDVMRGERATLGKSLLDVQRELRIKAAYIAAIENCDPDAFDTPGFIAGYVRSYARYLNMDPDLAFATFCEESGFQVSHGMSEHASVVRKSAKEDRGILLQKPNTAFAIGGGTPLTPVEDSLLSRIEPGAIGSMLVLAALIGAIGFGGYSILKEVQRVQVAPVEQAPAVLADLDPLEGAVTLSAQDETVSSTGFPQATSEALDRLYRPQALDVPVLVARDAPIASIDPREVGNFAAPSLERPEQVTTAALTAGPETGTPFLNVPQVVETLAPALVMVATAETWVRVTAADGSTIYEGIMQAGDSWEAPLTEEPPKLRTGNSGGVYFAMGDTFYGPVGASGQVTKNLALSVAGLQETYLPVDPQSQDGLVRYAEARGFVPAE